MHDPLRRQWRDLLAAWAVDPSRAEREFGALCTHYGEPGRFYHTLDHIRNVLDTVGYLGGHARNRNAVILAAWLHDVIYDSRATDNEARSARYAEALCESLSIPEGSRVAALILKTRTHDAADDPDTQVLLDADLGILGASESDYRQYAEQIRQEYAWVPESDYRTGRRQVLSRFLTRPRIYHLLTHLEAPARRNLEAEIARLTGD
jgi:predicted metal-dependent HD superfamily phosphohydrolase